MCYTVKSRLSKRRLSETTVLFEDYGQSWLFSLLSIAIKLPIIRISIIRKIQFFEVIKEIAIKLPFKIRSPNVTYGDHDFFVWLSSIYTPEWFSKQSWTGNWHRINVHTIMRWTIKWVK